MRSTKSEILGLFTSAVVSELALSGQALLDLTSAVLAKGDFIRFKARGWSMSPFIHDGDVVTIAKFKKSKPGLGDVIAFKRPFDGHLIVHRIIARYASQYVVRGDNISDKTDGTISLEDILGRVVSIQRGSRSIWIGLGPERFIIAWLSRMNFLIPSLNLIGYCRYKFSGHQQKDD